MSSSYGFRSNRSAHEALHNIKHWRTNTTFISMDLTTLLKKRKISPYRIIFSYLKIVFKREKKKQFFKLKIVTSSS